jgi:hypothetical protein
MRMEDDGERDELRKPGDVAKRALALFGVWGLTVGAPRDEILEWFDETGLSGKLSPRERDFVANAHPTEDQVVSFGWQAERLIVLLWALNVVESMPAADQKCEASAFRLPPFTEETADEFISRARLRDEAELSAQSERIYDLHVEAADARRHRRPLKEPVDIHIIHQRHHAINWIMGYLGQDWDDVTPDI